MEADLLDGDLANQHMGTVALGIWNALCVPLRLVLYVESADSTTEDRRIGVPSRKRGWTRRWRLRPRFSRPCCREAWRLRALLPRDRPRRPAGSIWPSCARYRGAFVTLFYAVLTAEGELTYCNAGHNPPFLVTRTGISRLETGGMPLGLFESTPLEQASVTLKPGDFVVTFSDGVSEAMNAAGEEFEDERIQSSIDGSAHDAQTQLEHLFSSVKTCTAGPPPERRRDRVGRQRPRWARRVVMNPES